MARDQTSGFDMLVQISENELNDQLAANFLGGGVFPPFMSAPINTGGVTGTADFNFATPIADLDRPRPRMGLTIPFANSQLQLTAPVATTLAPLGGTIVIVDTIEVITEVSTQIVTMDFNSGAPDVTVAFDTPSQVILAPAVAAAGMTLAQAENLMAGSVIRQLQSDIGRIDLSVPIPVADDADPTTIYDIDVTTVNDTSAADRDCMTFGVRMTSKSGGNINGVTTNLIPAGSDSLIMMSNLWLLARAMRPRVAEALGRPDVNDFDTPLRLNRDIPAPGGQGTLTRLEAYVEGNRIRVDGRATDFGTGWSAVSDFTFFIRLRAVNGSIEITADTPSVDTDVDLEWWVWLASLALGAQFFGIVGAIVAAIVLAIAEALAEGIVNNLAADGISGSLGNLAAIPLGPIGRRLEIDRVTLDDLELRGSIIRSSSVPVKSQGTHSALGDFTVDLDSGLISREVLAGTDLIWVPSRGFSTNGSTGLCITGSSFGALTPVQVSRLPLWGREIPLTLIPFGVYLSSSIVFGVRTTDGRYAKVRAWRSPHGGGILFLEWVTYDTPVTRLDVATRWSALERGNVNEYVRANCSFCRSSPVRWRGVVEAWPRLVAFPIDYQWCVCGSVIDEGEGQVSSPHGLLTYALSGRRLVIETEMGQDVDCELCVSAIDVRGHELFECVQLSKPGVDTRCRKCMPGVKKFELEIIPAAPELGAWRSLLADATVTVRDGVMQER